MPRSKQFLLEQIARAQRFARAMNTDADRERFEKMAADLRREFDAVEAAEGQSSAVVNANPLSQEEAVQTNSSAEAAPETADQEATVPAASSGGDQDPATD